MSAPASPAIHRGPSLSMLGQGESGSRSSRGTAGYGGPLARVVVGAAERPDRRGSAAAERARNLKKEFGHGHLER